MNSHIVENGVEAFVGEVLAGSMLSLRIDNKDSRFASRLSTDDSFFSYDVTGRHTTAPPAAAHRHRPSALACILSLLGSVLCT
ncbi:hypothetical protein L6452_20133 [Arctium lappa]|uniref:Uncharacterized protein n=1 Tax=Arctium lappa TaxID=4217 RepID=A0ACB9BCE6_ARCLA|nr:hypothetical protein L6452_20133 [Arctium lappa]